jgi:hypothetical protein
MMGARFPRTMSTFGVTPYAAQRDNPDKNRALYEHYLDQVSTQPMPDESMPWNVPFPPGVAAQEGVDEFLYENITDPLAKAGFEGLGAGLAAVPSAAHSMIVPQTEFDVAGTIIPLPGVAKAMKQGKYRKIRNAMKAEDPENVGKIIAEQASKEVPPSTGIEGPKAELRDINEKEIFRKVDESLAEEKKIDKMLRETKPASDWSSLRDDKYYWYNGEKVLGKDLREELLQLSTGDFHTAKWEPYKPENDMFKADQKARMKRDTEAIKIKEPPKGPKGDPEASLRPQEPQQFSRIRQAIDPTTARFDERGNVAGNVGQYDFMPYEQPAMPRFEDVQKRNYVEADLDSAEQLISKMLADPQNVNLSPEQKQALANFVRTRAKGNDKMLLKEDLVNRLGLREVDSRYSLENYVGSESARDDLEKLRIEHGIDDDRQTWKAYDDLDKNFGPNQSIISKRDPSVKRMFEMLYGDMPYGRSDTPLESAQELQRKMYEGRPSYDEEMAKIARESEPQKFGKTKEALKSNAPNDQWLDHAQKTLDRRKESLLDPVNLIPGDLAEAEVLLQRMKRMGTKGSVYPEYQRRVNKLLGIGKKGK